MHHLGQFLAGKCADAPQEALQILDIVLRELSNRRYCSVGRSFFSPDIRKPHWLGEGLESRCGFYQSIRPTQMGLSLNIDMSSAAFIEPLPVTEFVAQLLGKDVMSKMLSDSDHVAKAPDGNGGVYSALKTSNLLEDMAVRVVRYVDCYGVDNALVRVADPTFLGYFIDKGVAATAKVVRKVRVQTGKKKVEVASEPVETSSVLDGGDSLENHSSDPLDEISDESSTLHIQVEDSCNDDFSLLTTDQNQVVSVAEPKPAQNNVHTRNSVKNLSQIESLSQKESVTETKANNQTVSSTDE